MILDEDLYRRLRFLLERCWAGDENDQRAIAKFKRESADEDISEEDLTEIIRERYPDYGHSPRVEPVAPKPWFSEPQTEGKNETFTPTPAQESWADQVLAEELPDPKPKRKPKVFNRQSHEKKQWKLDLVAYFNRSKLNRRTGFTADSLRSQMTTLITTRTMYNYLEELFKEGEIKRWRQPREAGEKIAYRHWYSSLDNPDPKYVRWIEIG